MSLPHATIAALDGDIPQPGARPPRALSKSELRRLERSTRKVDNLLLAFQAWMIDEKKRPLRPITRKQYVMAVRRAMRFSAEGERSLLVGDVRSIRFVMGRVPAHPASQNMMRAALHTFYEFCKWRGLRKDNPMDQIGRHPRTKGEPRPVPLEDCMAYLDAGYALGPAHTFIALLAMLMGCRIDEVRRLKWGDFYRVAGGRWKVDIDGKGGLHRREPVHQLVVWARDRWMEATPDPTSQYVFPSMVAARYGQPVSQTWIRQRHLDMIDESDVAYFTFHQLRHSFASYMRKDPTATSTKPGKIRDLTVIQRALGHRHIASTQIYADADDQEVTDAVDEHPLGRWIPKEGRQP